MVFNHQPVQCFGQPPKPNSLVLGFISRQFEEAENGGDHSFVWRRCDLGHLDVLSQCSQQRNVRFRPVADISVGVTLCR